MKPILLLMLLAAATAGHAQATDPGDGDDGSDAPAAAAPAQPGARARVTVEEVSFPSTDGHSTIRGYLFRPEGVTGRLPAIVMMHGRSGAYSTLANGVYDANTLSSRHRAWGRLWARNGYAALMVDDFGPLGYPQGFGRFTYDERPAALNEVTQRPLHAYGALRYLRTRSDIDGDRIGLMGWSNGGSTTLAAMADDKVGDMRRIGFRAAVSFYPGCGLHNAYRARGYRPYAPVRLLMGLADAEVSPDTCRRLVERSRAQGGTIEATFYDGAEHSFDTPTRSRQSVPANAAAKAAAEEVTIAFFRAQLAPR